MSTTATNPAPTTDAELFRRSGANLPIGWDEYGSSQKDIYLENRARIVRRSIPCEVQISRFESAMDAWFWLYHERVDLEGAEENKTGICSACGRLLVDGGDHDDDTEEAQELGRLARRGIAAIMVTFVPGTNLPMAYVVSEDDGRWSASFGPY